MVLIRLQGTGTDFKCELVAKCLDSNHVTMGGLVSGMARTPRTGSNHYSS